MAGEHAAKRRRGTWVFVTLGVLLLVGIVFRLVLDPIAAHYTRQALAKSKSVRGAFTTVHVGVLPPGYTINRLKLIAEPGGRWDEPLFYAETTHISVLWRELLHGRLVARADIDHPKIVSVSKPGEKPKKPAPDIAQALRNLLPAKLDRLTIDRGEALIAQGHGANAPEVWIHDLTLIADNLATRRQLMEGEPSHLRLDGRVQRTGRLAVDASMNPFAKGLTFSVKAALRDLALRELYAFVEPQTKLTADKGTIDVFVEIRARNGVLSGGAKPELKDVDVKSADRGLGPRVKAALADATINLLEDERPGHDVVATTVPINGTIEDPHVQLVPAILGAARNGLVVGLASGFANLPPSTSEKKEGIVKQAWHAIKKGEGPPKAQPEPQQPEPRQGRTAPRSKK
jgi:hypothetical protein